MTRRWAPRVDHVRAAVQAAKRRGTTLREEIGRVMMRMIELAEAGDVSAAKLVLDRLGVPEAAARDDVPVAPQIVIVTGVPARDGATVQVAAPNANPHLEHVDVSQCRTTEEAAVANLLALGYGPDGRPLQDRAPRLLS